MNIIEFLLHVLSETLEQDLEAKKALLTERLKEEFSSYDITRCYRIKDEDALCYVAQHDPFKLLTVEEDREILNHQFLIKDVEVSFYNCGRCSLPHYHSIVVFNLDNKKLYKCTIDRLEFA